MTPEATTSEQAPSQELLNLYSPNFGRLTREQRTANAHFISRLSGVVESGDLKEPFTPQQAAQAMCDPTATQDELSRVASCVRFYCDEMKDFGSIGADSIQGTYWFRVTIYDTEPRRK